MAKKLIALLLAANLAFQGAYATQIKSVKDNATVSVKISAKELSRIFVENDRIQSTRGLNGAYELIKDEKSGVVYLKPTPFYANKAFNLFVTTENGHTYTLLLTPFNIPAENVELKPLSPSIKISSQWERNTPYVDLIIQLMNDMINDSNPEGFTVVPVRGQSTRLPDFTMELLSVYKGNHLEGEVWCLRNTSKKTQFLRPAQLFNTNTRAISIEDQELASGEETYIYMVVNHG